MKCWETLPCYPLEDLSLSSSYTRVVRNWAFPCDSHHCPIWNYILGTQHWGCAGINLAAAGKHFAWFASASCYQMPEMETFTGDECCSQLSWSNDPPPQTSSCVWRRWIYSVQLWWLCHFCPLCSGSFKESYLVCGFLFLTCILGFYFQFSVIDYFVFYFVEKNYWKIVLYC